MFISHPKRLSPLDQGDPFELRVQTYRAVLTVKNYLRPLDTCSENREILSQVVLSQYINVTDDRMLSVVCLS